MSDRSWIATALATALDSVAARLDVDRFPHVTSGGEWVLSDDGEWTGGFWIGLLWAGYEERGDPRFRVAAERLLRRFAARAGETRNHDLGMMFCPSAVKGYELTGDPRFREAGLEAARSLASQFNRRGGFIPGWGFFGDAGWEGAVLVDTLMNLPLLWWAADESEELERFRAVALSHGDTSLAHHLRRDGSTFHVYRFDPQTGVPIRGDTYQGKAPGSCWSRGQAWAIAGCARLARLGAGERYRMAAERAAAYYLDHLPDDLVPYWDFDAKPDEPRDTSAGAIAAYGLLLLDDEEASDAAERCLRTLVEHAQAPPGHPAILLHATADLPHGIAVDESTIYGDYFFVRALQLLRNRIHATAGAAAHETGG
ncbi:MAG TPA: glycoside hydrolase family 88 protein [Gaiellaceae bacterium]|nr:glycoside hydrolase family 88 protein [Gaiellaceae bacterium]